MRRIWWVSAAIIVVGAGALSAVAFARKIQLSHNSAATRQYAAAFTALATERKASLPLTEATVLAEVTQVKRHCPGVLAGALRRSTGTQIRDMEEELDGTLEVEAARTTARDTIRFSRRIMSLRWSNDALTELVHKLVIAANTVSWLPHVPRICSDMTAWAATGFRRLPSATTRFTMELNQPVRVGGSRETGGLEEMIGQRLMQYAARRTRKALRRASHDLLMAQERELTIWTKARYELFRDAGLRIPSVK
jgi:hypothetical protein